MADRLDIELNKLKDFVNKVKKPARAFTEWQYQRDWNFGQDYLKLAFSRGIGGCLRNDSKIIQFYEQRDKAFKRKMEQLAIIRLKNTNPNYNYVFANIPKAEIQAEYDKLMQKNELTSQEYFDLGIVAKFIQHEVFNFGQVVESISRLQSSKSRIVLYSDCNEDSPDSFNCNDMTLSIWGQQGEIIYEWIQIFCIQNNITWMINKKLLDYNTDLTNNKLFIRLAEADRIRFSD